MSCYVLQSFVTGEEHTEFIIRFFMITSGIILTFKVARIPDVWIIVQLEFQKQFCQDLLHLDYFTLIE